MLGPRVDRNVVSRFATAAAAVEQGDDERAKAIMEDWAVDAAGSAAGEALGAAVGGIAVGLLAAVGVVSAPVTAVVVFRGLQPWGSLAPMRQKDLYGALTGEDEADRREILRRLDALYFGEGSPLTTDTIPEQDSGFCGSMNWRSLGRVVSCRWNPSRIPQGQSRFPLCIAQAQSVHASVRVLYEQLHNANGELDRFDAASGKGIDR